MRRHIAISMAAVVPLLVAARPALALDWVSINGPGSIQMRATTPPGSIASFTDGAWAVGTDVAQDGNGNQVYEYDWTTNVFQPRTAGAIQIAIFSGNEPDGSISVPWAITKSATAGQGPIKKWNGSTFVVPPNGVGCARSIAVGPATGATAYVWVVGCDAPVNQTGDAAMYRYNASTGWQLVNPGGANGYGVQIAVDSSGTPWVINSAGYAYRGDLDANGFPVWSYAGPGGGRYVSGGSPFQFTATLLGWNYDIFTWRGGSTGWFDEGPGLVTFTQITGGYPNVWGVDNLGRVFLSAF
jgi:hypothetical protein